MVRRMRAGEANEEHQLEKQHPPLADHPHHDNILSLWRLLPKLYTAVRVPASSPSYPSTAEFHRTAKLFSRKLRVVYKDIIIIPYIHCLVFHNPQFLEMYETIYQFNCQLVEKKNKQHTSFFSIAVLRRVEYAAVIVGRLCS